MTSIKYQRPKYKEYKHTGDHTSTNKSIHHDFDLVQLKMDGMYATLTIRDNEWTITSRTGKIKAQGGWPNPYDDYILTGEYMKGSHWAKRNSDIDEVGFYAFDIQRMINSGSHMTSNADYHARDLWLDKAVTDISENSLDIHREHFKIYKVKTYPRLRWQMLWDKYVMSRDYEGLIFRNSYHELDWDHIGIARMKKHIEIDYICTGFEPAHTDSKYAGQVGAVKGTLIDKDVSVECGGLTDRQRLEYTADAEKYIGMIFTAKGNDWYPSGSIRHPKFKEWREDKTHYECSYRQIPTSIGVED
tara:strand:- start:21171 stop:22076 length:906 start_codon:yes stop_codon:yes gene_type:complete